MKIKILLIAAVMGVSVMASAQIQAPADSVSTALATSIGSYFRESVNAQYPADTQQRKEFMEALRKGILATAQQRPEYDGYAEGLKLADNLNRLRDLGFNVNTDMFTTALIDVIEGKSTGMTRQQAEAYLSECEKRNKQAEQATQQAFLDAQAAREGVIKTPSGLLSEVITEGEGASPTLDDTVNVYYTGRLADGKIFDQTHDLPATFPVKRLIPGFTEGLTMMKPGGTYRLFIPAELGYGDRGAGNDIPGGAALDFTVTLVNVK